MSSAARWRIAAELVLLAVVVGHALLCPFTKVEESFNLQAIHDILVHGHDLSVYDHHEFPGVVPRTFLGAIAVSAAAAPVHAILEAFGGYATRFASQLLARLTLGLMCWLAFRRFNLAAARKFGDIAAACTAVVSTLQFHLPFYLSRTLPNVFALCVVLLALEAWLRERVPRALGLLSLAVVVFRCDVLVLLAPLTLQLLLMRRIGIMGVIATGLTWAVPSVLVSVLVDSAMWGRWMWPEGQVVLFNTVDNRSSEWGAMPAHWYFTSALPRALSGTALLVPLSLLRAPAKPIDSLRRPWAAIDTAALSYLLPAVAMVSLYSFLPHKELRFVFPAIPLFNLAAGIGLSRALQGGLGWKARGKDDEDGLAARKTGNPAMRSTLLVMVGISILSTAATTLLAVAASRENYPGGVALRALHGVIDADRLEGSHNSKKDVVVHVDVEAAMSGVSRFGQRKRGIVYSKQEEAVDFSKFDYVVAGDYRGLLNLYEVRKAIEGYDRLNFRPFFWKQAKVGAPVLSISREEKMYVMARWYPPPPREDLA